MSNERLLEREMELEEELRQRRIAEARQAAALPAPSGRCLYCSDPVAPGLHFCPVEEPGLPGCRDDYEMEQAAKRRNGLA
ncbi:hypothetical protein [uncultured Halomonas sp.]|uniref:hypothetical protein n=1 Tax=uncultured Halomonas sp. TaxID=173971 RepID=UPI0026058895|nr:hypothetical protein [uncultured Halomonas sp.]